MTSNAHIDIDKLLKVLKRTGLLQRWNADEEDILDSLWLAVQMGDTEGKKWVKTQKIVIDLLNIEIFITFAWLYIQLTLLIIKEIPRLWWLTPKRSVSQTISDQVAVITENVSTPEIGKSASNQPKGLPFQVPAASAIQNPLVLSRALRGLRRKVPSMTKTMIDETATAERIAEREMWIPVTKPQPERWLTLELVIEDTRSSFIWRELINDLQKLLEVQGAFQNIRTWQLFTPDHETLKLRRYRRKGKTSQREYFCRELLHPQQRGLVLLVSDCVSPLWESGLIHPYLQKWSEKQPCAILQLFPERLWNSTQLTRGTKYTAISDRPAVPNPKLTLINHPQWLPIDWNDSVLVPIITLQPFVLKQWSGVIAGNGKGQVTSILFNLSFIKEKAQEKEKDNSVKATENSESELKTDEVTEKANAIVQQFFNNASENAIELATVMATLPVNMSVVDLVRKSYQGEMTTEPVHVAEFYMGGLLTPIGENKEGYDQGYDFVTGVRRVLNKSISSRRNIRILDRISEQIGKEIDRPIRSFRGLLVYLEDYPEDQEKVLPFAQVGLEVLKNLGGDFATYAEEIENRLKPLTQPNENDNINLKIATFEVATIEVIETQIFTFTVATLQYHSSSRSLRSTRKRRWEIKHQEKQAEGMIEALDDQVNLELMEIPSGTFVMGTPDEEIERLVKKFNWDYFRREKGQHLVTVPAFYMGRYPITQAQWRIIAEDTSLRVARDLNPDPSSFKEDYEGIDRWQRPVESVSWYDAIEFCARLSKKTGRNYRLATEAEWEYACRSRKLEVGSRKEANNVNVGEQGLRPSSKALTIEEWNRNYHQPFHFGETITGALANYNVTYLFADEEKGTYREQTTPVGYFKVANEFGLYDLHGNVWEWCFDPWHESYEREDVPKDGTVWNENKNQYQDVLINTSELLKSVDRRVVRGGSWFVFPYLCRSAYRDSINPVVGYDLLGFRVVCASPSTLLYQN